MLAFPCVWSLQWFFSWLVATTLGTSNMLTVHFWHLWMPGFTTPWHWVCVNTVSLHACHHSGTLSNQIWRWSWYSNKPQSPVVLTLMHLHWPPQTRNVGATEMEETWNTVLVFWHEAAWLQSFHHYWEKLWGCEIMSVLSVLINSCLQTLLRLWCTSHRCVWSAHALRTHCVLAFEIGTDSYCTSCLHYSHYIPVTLLPGVISILYYHISGAQASKPAGNFTATADQWAWGKTTWPCVILVKVVLCM